MKYIAMMLTCFSVAVLHPTEGTLFKIQRPPLSAFQDSSEQVATFQKKFLKWKKKLTTEQKQHFEQLLELYHTTYLQYRKKPDVYTTKLIMAQIQTLDHMMDHWDTFYSVYTKYQMQYAKFLTWKQHLSAQKHHALYEKMAAFEDMYEQYDENPVNVENQINMEKQYKIMNQLMAK